MGPIDPQSSKSEPRGNGPYETHAQGLSRTRQAGARRWCETCCGTGRRPGTRAASHLHIPMRDWCTPRMRSAAAARLASPLTAGWPSTMLRGSWGSSWEEEARHRSRNRNRRRRCVTCSAAPMRKIAAGVRPGSVTPSLLVRTSYTYLGGGKGRGGEGQCATALCAGPSVPAKGNSSNTQNAP